MECIAYITFYNSNICTWCTNILGFNWL